VSSTAPPHDATPFLPERRNLAALREAAAGCRGCPLFQHATQTVFGEGPRRAQVMLIGEMPGDQEDRQGHVFVGPAGRELDRGLQAAGLDRGEAYLTNVVKHFRFEERGKRRIHQTPRRWEVNACLPWLRAELDVVTPRAVVLLGATAVTGVLGPGHPLAEVRGRPIPSDLAELVVATTHPSAILRAPDSEARTRTRAGFTHDLETVARFLAGSPR
jgi:uracil-DNA glycosylase family protein